MKTVDIYDEQGWLRRYEIRDDMVEFEATAGLPISPPDLTLLNCDEILKELHNMLTERNLITIDDIQRTNTRLSNTILAVMLPKIMNLYKQLSAEPIIIGTNGKSHLQDTRS